MSSVIPFEFHGSEVRTLVGEDGGIWFVLSDVCRVLEIGNPSDAAKRLDEEEVTLDTIEGSNRRSNVINESGMYSLVLTSRKESAKRFKKWVTSEVLPTIRRTGTYTRDENAPIDPFMASLNAMEELDRAMQVFSVSQGDKVKLLHLSMKAQGLGVDHVSSDLMDAVLESPVASWTRMRIRDDIHQAVKDAGELQFHELMDACEIDDDSQQFDAYCTEIESMVAEGELRTGVSIRPVPGTNGQVSVYTL